MGVASGQSITVYDAGAPFAGTLVSADRIYRINVAAPTAVSVNMNWTNTADVDILFVNNLAAPGGNGSIEAPFSSLKDAEVASEAGDVIYVFPGDGTPRNMEEGIILKDDQVIASSGAPLTLEEISIPPMTPGETPVITNIHPDEPVIVNPGGSNLEDFRIIEPWEYFFGDWSFFLGDDNSANIDGAIDEGLGAQPLGNSNGANYRNDPVIVAPMEESDNSDHEGDDGTQGSNTSNSAYGRLHLPHTEDQPDSVPEDTEDTCTIL